MLNLPLSWRLLICDSPVTERETVKVVVRTRKLISDTMCMRFEKIHRPFVDTTYGFPVTDQSKWPAGPHYITMIDTVQ